MSVRTTYQIKGMTCGHCAQTVTAELTSLMGVHQVEVDVPMGSATVTSDAPLPIDEVRNTIDEAGYQLVGIDG